MCIHCLSSPFTHCGLTDLSTLYILFMIPVLLKDSTWDSRTASYASNKPGGTASCAYFSHFFHFQMTGAFSAILCREPLRFIPATLLCYSFFVSQDEAGGQTKKTATLKVNPPLPCFLPSVLCSGYWSVMSVQQRMDLWSSLVKWNHHVTRHSSGFPHLHALWILMVLCVLQISFSSCPQRHQPEGCAYFTSHHFGCLIL